MNYIPSIALHIESLCKSIDRRTVRRRWLKAVREIQVYGLSREESIGLVMRLLREREKFRQDTELTIEIVKKWK